MDGKLRSFRQKSFSDALEILHSLSEKYLFSSASSRANQITLCKTPVLIVGTLLCFYVLGDIFNTKGRLMLIEVLISKESDPLFLSAQ